MQKKHRAETEHLMGQQTGIHRKAEWADLRKAVEATGLLPAPILNEYKGSLIQKIQDIKS